MEKFDKRKNIELCLTQQRQSIGFSAVARLFFSTTVDNALICLSVKYRVAWTSKMNIRTREF
jgi:hypothetical protein